MKKLLIVLVAALSLFAMVSCKEEVEPARPVKVSYDGKTYECNYVGANYCLSDCYVAVAFYPEFSDVVNLENVFEFEIPFEMIGKTSVAGTDSFEGDEWDFWFDYVIDGEDYELDDVEDGSKLTFSCKKNTDYEILDFTINFAGKVGGKDLSVSFSGEPDFSILEGYLY